MEESETAVIQVAFIKTPKEILKTDLGVTQFKLISPKKPSECLVYNEFMWAISSQKIEVVIEELPEKDISRTKFGYTHACITPEGEKFYVFEDWVGKTSIRQVQSDNPKYSLAKKLSNFVKADTSVAARILKLDPKNCPEPIREILMDFLKKKFDEPDSL